MVQANMDSSIAPDKSLETAIWTVQTNGTNLVKLAGEKDSEAVQWFFI